MEVSSGKPDIRTQKRSELGQFRNWLPRRWSVESTAGTHHCLTRLEVEGTDCPKVMKEPPPLKPDSPRTIYPSRRSCMPTAEAL